MRVCLCVVLSFLGRRSHLLKWKNTTTNSIKGTSEGNVKTRSSHCVPLCVGGWDYIIHTPPTCPRDLVVQSLGAMIPLDGSVSCSRSPDTGSFRLTVVTDIVHLLMRVCFSVPPRCSSHDAPANVCICEALPWEKWVREFLFLSLGSLG
jgi:hypothetical protein